MTVLIMFEGGHGEKRHQHPRLAVLITLRVVMGRNSTLCSPLLGVSIICDTLSVDRLRQR